MVVHQGEQFFGLFDRGDALDIEGMTFEDCTFTHSALSLTRDIARRSTVNRVHIQDCSVNECDIGPAVLNHVTIDGLRTNDLFIIWGALFNQVRISGEIGRIKINHYVHFADRSPEIQRPFDDFRLSFYDQIEWALDISAARFKYFEVRGIPARLFRLDPESQAVVTRERAMAAGRRDRLSDWNREWRFAIDLFPEGRRPGHGARRSAGSAKGRAGPGASRPRGAPRPGVGRARLTCELSAPNSGATIPSQPA